MTEPSEVREDPSGWHVTWGTVFFTAFTIVVMVVVIYIFATPSSSSDDHGKFWCNGSTGVYESRDGSAIVPEPYDPACNKVDEP